MKLNDDLFYYDNTMVVDINMAPFFALIGNLEYQSLMKMLDRNVTYNDGLDEFYIKDFIKRENMKEPTGMYVNINMDSIGLVTLDNK